MRLALLCLLFASTASLADAQLALPITFEEEVDYELTPFGGAEARLVADPTDAENTVAEFVRTAGAASFAGVTVAETSGFSEPLPFAEGATTMSVRVWTPAARTPVRLKVEKVGDPTVSVEAQVNSTMAGAWETLVFDFANEVAGTAELNFDSEYTKASIFFDFGREGAAAPTTFYWDDLAFGGEAPPPAPRVELPVTFEQEIDYELNDFGGNSSALVPDPTDATNTVVRSVRTDAAECFAGTTVADATGFAERIPFSAGNTTMSVRVWSPEAGVRVRFKVEKYNDPTISVEADRFTTVAGAWETLEYDFVADQVPNTAPINFASEYSKASIFFNFQCGVGDADLPEQTYYWDDVAFGSGSTSAEGGTGLPEGVHLMQNAPNPVRGATTIRFSTPRAERVALHVYTVLGQRVATLVDGVLAAGDHEVTLDASSLASGTYVYRLHYGAASAVQSLAITR